MCQMLSAFAGMEFFAEKSMKRNLRDENYECETLTMNLIVKPNFLLTQRKWL